MRKKYLSILLPWMWLAWLALLSSCAVQQNNPQSSPQYNADTLAKDWREQVRKNRVNPYEGYIDNDYGYYPPVAPKQKAPAPQKVYKYQSKRGQGYVVVPPVDNEDTSYGRFPRYNPDDDNMYLDPKDYPLYME